jgi:hypothetical protein
MKEQYAEGTQGQLSFCSHNPVFDIEKTSPFGEGKRKNSFFPFPLPYTPKQLEKNKPALSMGKLAYLKL